MQVMVGNNFGSYAFNASTGVITFSGLPSALVAGQVKLIINARTNTIIFNLADPTQTATYSGNSITLAYNTSAMNNNDPLQIFMEVAAEYVQQSVAVSNFPMEQLVTGTFWQATQPISGSVDVGNFPESQAVTGTVAVSNLPETQAVSGSVSVSNFPVTQPVSGTVAISNSSFPVTGTFWQTTQPVSGTVDIANFPTTQPVSGSVAVTNFPETQAVSGSVTVANSSIAVTGTFYQATQPVSGSVSVSNFPTTQAVTGTFWQTTQPVSGSVSVSNLPATQAVSSTQLPASLDGSGNLKVAVENSVGVTGTFWQSTQPVSGTVAINNFPATQPVSISDTVAVSGTFWQTTQPVSGSVSVSNFPTTQPVSWSGQSVGITGSVAVTGTFWQATQPVSGTVSVSGTVAVADSAAEASLSTIAGAVTSAQMQVNVTNASIPVSVAGTLSTTDTNIAQVVASNGSTMSTAKLIIVGGLTNDALQEYQELPLGPGGNAVLVNGSAFTQPVSGTVTAVLAPLSSNQADGTIALGDKGMPFAQMEGTLETATYDTNMANVFGTQPLRGVTNRLMVEPQAADVTATGFMNIARNTTFGVLTAGYTTATIQIGGVWTGTITFEVFAYGANDVSTVYAIPVNSTTPTTTTTTNGIWRVNVTGTQRVQVHFTTPTSGSPTVTITNTTNEMTTPSPTAVTITGTATVSGSTTTLQQKTTTNELITQDDNLFAILGNQTMIADAGGPPPAGVALPLWFPTTAYVIGNVAFYNGTYWACVVANTGSAPNPTNANWVLIGPQSRLKVAAAGHNIGDPALVNPDGTYQVAVRNLAENQLLERIIRLLIDSNQLLLALATSAGSNLSDFNPMGEMLGHNVETSR